MILFFKVLNKPISVCRYYCLYYLEQEHELIQFLLQQAHLVPGEDLRTQDLSTPIHRFVFVELYQTGSNIVNFLEATDGIYIMCH